MTGKTKRKKLTPFDVVVHIIALFLLAIVVYPLILVLSSSISDPQMVATGKVLLLPKGITFDGYAQIFQNQDILIGYANTIFYTVIGTLLNLLVTVPAGYVLSKKTVPGNRFFMTLFMITMYFSGGMIPKYLLIKELGLTNNFLVYILPCLITGFALIITRNFFMGLPPALEESAKIDGASNLTVLFKIYLPLSTPVVATIALWYCVQHWNSWMDNMLYVTKNSLYVLQYVLQTILNNGQTADMEAVSEVIVHTETMKMAALILALLPIVCTYPFLQKYFVKGMIVGSVKG